MADTIRQLCDDDADTFLDTLDGETDALDVLGKLIEERVQAKSFEEANKAIAQQYWDRAKRMVARQEAISQTIGHLLDAIGETKVQHPLATVSRTKARQKVKVVEEGEVPTQLCKVTTRPDLTAIKAQLDAGVNVPGVEIEIGNPSITVRMK